MEYQCMKVIAVLLLYWVSRLLPSGNSENLFSKLAANRLKIDSFVWREERKKFRYFYKFFYKFFFSFVLVLIGISNWNRFKRKVLWGKLMPRIKYSLAREWFVSTDFFFNFFSPKPKLESFFMQLHSRLLT